MAAPLLMSYSQAVGSHILPRGPPPPPILTDITVLVIIEGTACVTVLPVYSVFDVTEDVVDPFSQSFSPFLLLDRLGDRKPSAESGL